MLDRRSRPKLVSLTFRILLECTNGLTAQSRDAAAKLSKASGIGVTLCTHDTLGTMMSDASGDTNRTLVRTTYWLNVPLMVNPLTRTLAQSGISAGHQQRTFK